MRHNWFKAKDTSFKIIDKSDSDIEVMKFTLIDGLTVLDSVTPTAKGDFFIAEIATPNENCWIFTIQNGACGMVRVGSPEILTIGYTGIEAQTHTHSQYDMDGTEVGTGDMTEIGKGFYYCEPFTLSASFVVLLDEIIKPLVVPYGGVKDGSGGSSGIIKIESDRFEMVSIPVRGQTVHSYFIAKIEEATGKPASESIELVKAYPSNSLSKDKYIGFVPGVTNPAGSYNFKLVEDDAGDDAIVPFLVRTKVLDAPIEISWTTEDEVI